MKTRQSTESVKGDTSRPSSSSEKAAEEQVPNQRGMYIRVACSTNQLKNLNGLPVTRTHLKEINATPFGKLKDLGNLKLQPGLLEYLLRYWVQEGVGGNFKLGSRMVPFSVEDVAEITGLPNEGAPLTIDNKKANSKWAMRHFKGEKINQNVIREKLVAQLEKDRGNSPNVKDGARLYILYIFANVLFAQTNGLCSGMLCDILEDLSSLGTFNWARAVHTFLVGYVRKTSYLATVRAGGEKASAGNLCGASWILQVWLYEHTRLWAGKTYEAGVPRYVRWLGRVQVSRVAGRTPNLVYKRGEYEHLLSSVRDIDVRVKMEGMTGVPDYEPPSTSTINEDHMTIILGKCERNNLRLKYLEDQVKGLEEQVAALKAESEKKDRLIKNLFELVEPHKRVATGAKADNVGDASKRARIEESEKEEHDTDSEEDKNEEDVEDEDTEDPDDDSHEKGDEIDESDGGGNDMFVDVRVEENSNKKSDDVEGNDKDLEMSPSLEDDGGKESPKADDNEVQTPPLMSLAEVQGEGFENEEGATARTPTAKRKGKEVVDDADDFVDDTSLVMCKRTRKKARQLVSPYTELKSSASIIFSTKTPSVSGCDDEDSIVYYAPLEKLEKADRTIIDNFRLCKGAEPGTVGVTRAQVFKVLQDEHIHSAVLYAYLLFIHNRQEDIAMTDSDDEDGGGTKHCYIADTFVATFLHERAHNITTNDAKLKNQLAGLGRMSNKVLLPILHDDHYFMIAANRSDGIMTYYNSLGLIDKTSLEYAKVVKTELEKILVERDVVQDGFKWQWVEHKVGKIYKQDNVVDCAIFVILFADCYTRRRPINFTQ